MDPKSGLTSRWAKKPLKSRAMSEGGPNEERKFLLDDDPDDADIDLGWNNNFRVWKAKDEDKFGGDELLIPMVGRPPTRPPNDQCVEAEIRPTDTLASLSLKYNVPVAELKRVNRLINDKDLFAKNVIKIPVKTASLLTEILPASDRQSGNSAVETTSDNCLIESPTSVRATPEVRRAQRLLHKIDDNVRNISMKQDSREQELGPNRFSHEDVRALLVEYGKGDNSSTTSCFDKIKTNKEWICFYLFVLALAGFFIFILTKYETTTLAHNAHTNDTNSHTEAFTK